MGQDDNRNHCYTRTAEKYLKRSPSYSWAYRSKRTLSDTEKEDRSTSPNAQNRMAESLIPPEAEHTDIAIKSLAMSVRVQFTYAFVF